MKILIKAGDKKVKLIDESAGNFELNISITQESVSSDIVDNNKN